MTMNPEEIKAYYTDSKVAELAVAFKRVEPADNWKKAIHATVTVSGTKELDDIREAVIFYTGSVPTFTPVPGQPNVFNVDADGYYKAIGS